MITPEVKALQAALRVAKKKIPMLSAKTRNANLEHAADDMAEAYEIGMEEGQSEIVERIQKLLKEAECRS